MAADVDAPMRRLAEMAPGFLHEKAAVEPFDFGPGRGWGMRALRQVSEGEAVLHLDSRMALTTGRARALLAAWAVEAAAADGVPPRPAPFAAVSELVVGQVVRVLEDQQAVLNACRDCGIGEDNDAARCAVLGRCARVRELDASDGSAEVRAAGGEPVWLAAAALEAAPPAEAAALVGDEDPQAPSAALRGASPSAAGAPLALAAYAAAVPAAFGSPLFWTEQELDELEGSNYAARARGMRAEALAAHRALSATFGRALAVDAEAFAWGLGAVRSRVFGLDAGKFPLLAAEGCAAMLPYVDLCNHDPDIPPQRCLVRESSAGGTIELVAARDYAEGDEVFISYGFKRSSELMLGWGFLLPGDANDAVELEMGVERARDPSATCSRACRYALSLSPDCELLETSCDGEPLPVRVLLTASQPVPRLLLGLCRLERLPAAEAEQLAALAGEQALGEWLQSGAALAGMRCPGASWALRGAALLADLLAAASLRAVLLALLGRYPTSLGEDEAILERAEGPRRLAVSLRAREKRVLWAGLRAVGSELGAAFRGVLEAAAARPLGAEAQCAEVQGAVDAQRARVEEVFRQLWGPSLGDEEVTRASWVQASYYLFLCLHRLHEHPEAQQMALVPERWPGVPRGMGHGTSIAAAVEGNELLATYCEKMRMWGTYLVAQFLVTGRLSVEDTNTMSKESVSIRKQTAWSVPTAEALDCLARFTPLLELGAGSGLWARLLRGRGADVQARSLGRWSGRFGGAAGGAGPPEEGCSLEAAPALGVVAEGGPEAAASGGDRNLVLMWPDYGGGGTFGLECLRGWLAAGAAGRARHLLCVGEWGLWPSGVPGLANGRPGTFALGTGAGGHGQSFSQEFQDLVAERFELVEEVPLPRFRRTRTHRHN
ncbi:unnamed protein product [Prorocentrum cordatum]|uniref:SET domain-containing protein n=1 Tax=Prorocentrum cordatum TaxID=2364126 RepID=A0ABN9QEF7_9DINO|nr:unnamed protein product [Polarella glacialis]